LVKDPNERWTAKQCKEHPWLSGAFGSSAPLIGEKMTTYNQQRKDEKKK